MENEQATFLDKIGGRKFLISIVAMIALITIAIMSPASLTTELIVGLLGVIATYSGSNTFLSNAFSKIVNKGSAVSEQPQQEPAASAAEPQQMPQVESSSVPREELEPVLNALNSRVQYLETTLSQVVDIVKQQNLALSKLQQK